MSDGRLQSSRSTGASFRACTKATMSSCGGMFMFIESDKKLYSCSFARSRTPSCFKYIQCMHPLTFTSSITASNPLHRVSLL